MLAEPLHHRQKRGGLRSGGFHLGLEAQEIFSGLVCLVVPELYFERCPLSVIGLNDRIYLEIGVVPIIANLSLGGFGVYQQVAQAKALEKEPEGVEPRSFCGVAPRMAAGREGST